MKVMKKSSFVVWHLFWFLPGLVGLGYWFLQDLPRIAPVGRFPFARLEQMQPYTDEPPTIIRFLPQDEQKILMVGESSTQLWNLSASKVDIRLEIGCPMLSADGKALLGLFSTDKGELQIYHWNTALLENRIPLRALSSAEQADGECPFLLTSDGTKALIWRKDKDPADGLVLEVWQLNEKGGILIQTRSTFHTQNAFFSPDGSMALMQKDKNALLWHIPSNTITSLEPQLPSSDAIKVATFSNDNQYLIVQSKKQKAWVIDTKHGQALFPLHQADSDRIEAVLPLGKTGFPLVAYGTDHQSIWLRRWESATELYRTLFEESAFSVETFALFPDNQRMAFGTRDGKIHMVDTTNGHGVGTWQAHDGPITRLHVSQSAQRLVSMDEDGVIRTWKLPERQLQFTTYTTPHRINTLVLSPDGKQALGSHKDHLWWLDLVGGRMYQRATLHEEDAVLATAFPLFSHGVAAITKNHCAYQWKAQQWHTICNIAPQLGTLHAAAFSKNQTQMALADATQLGLYTTQSDLPIWSVQEPSSAWITALAFSPDNSFVLTGNAFGKLYLWDTTNPDQWGGIAFLGEQEGKIVALALSPTGKEGVSVDHKGVAKVWDFSKREERFTLRTYKRYSVRTCTFSPDGQKIMMLLGSGKAQVWDARSGRALFLVEEPNAALQTAVFSPDGQEIWTTSTADASVRRWNIQTRVSQWLWNSQSLR